MKRWLDPRLNNPVGIKPVKFDGWAELVRDVPVKAAMYTNNADVIAVVSLLDLYGPTFFPDDIVTVADRLIWGKQHVEEAADLQSFRHFFAVHEVEAWVLSQPTLLPDRVRQRLPAQAGQPETVNFDTPPAVLLNRLYTQVTGRGYKKVAYGKNLFDRLDPDTAYEKCPQLKALLDEMLLLAKNAGL